jgi:hypothetical protein
MRCRWPRRSARSSAPSDASRSLTASLPRSSGRRDRARPLADAARPCSRDRYELRLDLTNYRSCRGTSQLVRHDGRPSRSPRGHVQGCRTTLTRNFLIKVRRGATWGCSDGTTVPPMSWSDVPLMTNTDEVRSLVQSRWQEHVANALRERGWRPARHAASGGPVPWEEVASTAAEAIWSDVEAIVSPIVELLAATLVVEASPQRPAPARESPTALWISADEVAPLLRTTAHSVRRFARERRSPIPAPGGTSEPRPASTSATDVGRGCCRPRLATWSWPSRSCGGGRSFLRSSSADVASTGPCSQW